VKKIKHKTSNRIESLIHSAKDHQRSGNLDQAEHIYNEIVKFRPRNADVYFSLGNILQDRGKLDKAISSYKKAIQINPSFPGSYYNLGSIFKEKGDIDKAIKYYKKCIQIDSSHPDTYNTLGVLFQCKKNLNEATIYFQHALQLNPHFDQPYNNLGLIFQKKKQLDTAIQYFQKALQLNPRYVKAYYNLGNALQEKGKLDEAIVFYQKVCDLDPDFLDVYEKLGTALHKTGAGDKAIECYHRALSVKSDWAGPYIGLGRVFRDQGKYREAEECFRRSIEITPNCFACYSNLLFQMLYTNEDSGTIFAEHLNFAKHCAGPLTSQIPSHTNNRSTDRKLKIGYVSLDFRSHSVAYFFEPVLSAHDRERFETFCYSDVLYEDEITERIKARANIWRDVVEMSDEQTADLIRKDQIDILVDLSGLTSPRILSFARKPAPVQVTWIGYPATTGISTIDYKIVDNVTDPSGIAEQFYTETLIRMPDCFLCYQSDRDGPGINQLPALESGHITFGSFNNFAKLSPQVFALWSEVLIKIPDAHLVMKAWSFSDKKARQHALEMFSKENVAAERITLLSYKQSSREHLSLYNMIDIGLDTFPYNGTTTTCEALWMGIPVITLAGNAHVSRVGMSLLSTVGLPEFVARTSDEFVDIAVNLAADLNKLNSLRERLRGMMQSSPLMNAKEFTVNLETCYRLIWDKWCRTA
jgi:protein O-GlcNAc transferase